MTNVFINGKVLGDYQADAYKGGPLGDPLNETLGTGLTIAAGDGDTLWVYIPDTELSSGTTIELKLHSAAGMDYPKLITLP